MSFMRGLLKNHFTGFITIFFLVSVLLITTVSVFAADNSDDIQNESADDEDSVLISQEPSVPIETFTVDRITYGILQYPEGEKDGTVRLISHNLKKTTKILSLDRFVLYNNHFYELTEIGDAAFAMSGLESIAIPWSVEKIGKSCFYGCTELTSLEFSVRLKEVGDGAFSYCTALSSLKIEKINKNFKMKNGILYSADFTELVSAVLAEGDVTVNKKTVNIRPFAFEGNQKITSITTQKGLKTIGERAFFDCRNLKQVLISSSVNKIDGNPFIYCDSLNSIDIDAKNKKYCVIDNLLLSKSGKVVYSGMASSGETELPESVCYISDYAFCGNTRITGISFNKKFKAVRTGAFYDCRNLSYVRFDSLNTEVSGSSDTVPSFGNTTYFLEVSLPKFNIDESCKLFNSLQDNCPTKTIFTVRQ